MHRRGWTVFPGFIIPFPAFYVNTIRKSFLLRIVFISGVPLSAGRAGAPPSLDHREHAQVSFPGLHASFRLLACFNPFFPTNFSVFFSKNDRRRFVPFFISKGQRKACLSSSPTIILELGLDEAEAKQNPVQWDSMIARSRVRMKKSAAGRGAV